MAILATLVRERTVRRYIDRDQEPGLEGYTTGSCMKSHTAALVDKVLRLETLYTEDYDGWNVQHFRKRCREHHQRTRSYTWGKSTLQKTALVPKGRRKGTHGPQQTLDISFAHPASTRPARHAVNLRTPFP
ncbi:MAG: hypothetical protein EA417_14800 [Gammaproteobacteria bacterium]|nr:MAG: hypothetical protein EA417_14800 [Gammaproteobacteria bacterium]